MRSRQLPLAASLVLALTTVAHAGDVELHENALVADAFERPWPGGMEDIARGFPAISANGARVVALRPYHYAGDADRNALLEGLTVEFFDTTTGQRTSVAQVFGLPARLGPPPPETTLRARIRALNQRVRSYRPLAEIDEPDGASRFAVEVYPRFIRVRDTATRHRLRIALTSPSDAHAIPRPVSRGPRLCPPSRSEPRLFVDPETLAVLVVDSLGPIAQHCDVMWSPFIGVIPPTRWR